MLSTDEGFWLGSHELLTSLFQISRQPMSSCTWYEWLVGGNIVGESYHASMRLIPALQLGTVWPSKGIEGMETQLPGTGGEESARPRQPAERSGCNGARVQVPSLELGLVRKRVCRRRAGSDDSKLGPPSAASPLHLTQRNLFLSQPPAFPFWFLTTSHFE